MKRIALTCPSINEKIDVTYGLRKLRNFALREPQVRATTEIDIVPMPVAEDESTAVEKLLARSPDMVGISTFIWNVKGNLGIAEKIKERSPSTLVVLGGPQVSDPMWNILDHTAAPDLLVRGEGEATFADVLQLWGETGGVASTAVPGISFKNGEGGTVHNRDRPLIPQLDDIPHIYEGFEAQPDVLYGLETTRGCYLRCGYCSMGSIPFRKHSLEYVLQEVDNMAAAGVKKLNLLDSSFTFHPRRNAAIARRLQHHGIRYICCGKAEELSSEFIDLLLETGLIKIEFGLQATNPETLRLMGRRMKKDRFENCVREVVDKCRGTDVEVAIDVISGLPGDNLETFCETLDFAYSLETDGVSAFPLQLLPGTDFFRRSEELGIRRMSVTKPIFEEHGRYNLHRYGLVVANSTFSEEEVEKGRRICLLNALVLQAHLTKMVQRILAAEGIRFSTWLERLASLLPADIYGKLESIDADPSFRKEVWSSLRNGMIEYALQTSNTEVYATISERFPEAKRTAQGGK